MTNGSSHRPGHGLAFKLFLLFTLVPVLELALLIKVGTWLGVWPTVGVVILTGIAGAYLARAQGFATLRNIRRDMDEGVLPAEQLLNGAFVLAGGLLLLTPGFVTDALGFLCLIPPTRNLIKIPIKRWLKGHIEVHFG